MHRSFTLKLLASPVEQARLNSKWSTRDICVNSRDNLARKGKQGLLRRLHVLGRAERCTDSYERSIASVHTDGVGHQVELGSIFAGDGSVVRPVPVEDKLAF